MRAVNCFSHCLLCWENKEQAAIPDKVENNMDYSDINKEEKENLPAAAIKASEQDVTILYAGSDFIKSVFAVGEDMLQVCGIKDDGEYFLGLMPEEGKTLFQYLAIGKQYLEKWRGTEEKDFCEMFPIRRCHSVQGFDLCE